MCGTWMTTRRLAYCMVQHKRVTMEWQSVVGRHVHARPSQLMDLPFRPRTEWEIKQDALPTTSQLMKGSLSLSVCNAMFPLTHQIHTHTTVCSKEPVIQYRGLFNMMGVDGRNWFGCCGGPSPRYCSMLQLPFTHFIFSLSLFLFYCFLGMATGIPPDLFLCSR